MYDRHVTVTTVALGERIQRCRRYAVEHGWVVAGEWVDRGDHALTRPRPQWEALTYAMRQAAARPVCLIDTWDRISRERDASAMLRMAVHQAGGYCVTTAGEEDVDVGYGQASAAAPLALRGQR
ncbi:recombinase family protein [Streptomyces sp. MAR4 CNX-425]|uniref:recombinase family protein n=1 Tax=Streptomyces sp. MAR4 CNX-425 TaxID=3406343 RepID=UPI003B512BF8